MPAPKGVGYGKHSTTADPVDGGVAHLRHRQPTPSAEGRDPVREAITSNSRYDGRGRDELASCLKL